MTPHALAEAVKEQLLAAEFCLTPQSITRGYHPSFELTATNQLQLIVVPLGQTRSLNDETAWDRETRIGVAILYKFAAGSGKVVPNSLIDPLAKLVIEVADYFGDDDYTPPGDLGAEEIELEQLYIPRHLEEYRQFTSLIVVTYREVT